MTYIVVLHFSQPGMPPCDPQYLSHGCPTRIESLATRFSDEYAAACAERNYRTLQRGRLPSSYRSEIVPKP